MPTATTLQRTPGRKSKFSESAVEAFLRDYEAHPDIPIPEIAAKHEMSESTAHRFLRRERRRRYAKRSGGSE